MLIRRIALAIALGAAVGCLPTAAQAQAKVFGLDLGEPLPVLPKCPRDPALSARDMCVWSSSGSTWVSQPPGRYPAWADYVAMRLTLGKDRRVDHIAMRLHSGTRPEPVAASLTTRFGKPELAHQEPGFSVWRWRGEGIGAALLCSSECSLEFVSARAMKERDDGAAARQKADAARSLTP